MIFAALHEWGRNSRQNLTNCLHRSFWGIIIHTTLSIRHVICFERGSQHQQYFLSRIIRFASRTDKKSISKEAACARMCFGIGRWALIIACKSLSLSLCARCALLSCPFYAFARQTDMRDRQQQSIIGARWVEKKRADVQHTQAKSQLPCAAKRWYWFWNRTWKKKEAQRVFNPRSLQSVHKRVAPINHRMPLKSCAVKLKNTSRWGLWFGAWKMLSAVFPLKILLKIRARLARINQRLIDINMRGFSSKHSALRLPPCV